MQPSRVRPLTRAVFATSLALLAACGGSSSNSTPIPSAPTLTSVAPPSGPAAGGTAITVTGTNFATGATVTLGGASATGVTVTGPTTITATTPAHAAGAVDVVVTNPDGRSATLASSFTYDAAFAPPALTLTAVSPTTGHTGSDVALTGTGFQPNATVTFGGVNGTVVGTSDTTLSVTAPAHAPGAVEVRVTNPDGQTVTLPASFTYVAPPTLASLSPTSGTTAGGDAVTLTGTGFVPGVSGSTVSFGDAAATVTVNSTTSITATTPPHVAATADVTVTNPDGQVATLAGAFTFNAPGGTGLPPPPSITTLDVTSGPTTGGTRFNINGSFTTGATVTFGGVAGVNPQVQNTGGFVTVTTPQHLAGAVAVSVTDAFGQVATKPAAFTFLGPTPTITAVNIGGAPPQGGTTVLVVGTNFDRAAKVTFGGAASLNVVSLSTQLTVTTPPQPDAREFVPLVVTNPDGQSATATFPLGDFHYGPPPLPTDFFVDGNAASKTLPNGKAGQLIDVVGSGFSLDPNAVPPRGVQVLFSGITADSSGFGTNDARSTPTTLVVGIPKLNPGTYQLIVTNFDGQFARAPGTLVILGP